MPSELKFRKAYIKKAEYFVEPVENRVADGGADTYNVIEYGSGPAIFWVELKHIDTAVDRVHFRQQQEPWLRKQVEMGVNAYVLVKAGSGINAIYKVFGIDAIPQLKQRHGFFSATNLFHAQGKGALDRICLDFVIHHSSSLTTPTSE